MFWPNRTYTAPENWTIPPAARVCKMPTEAEEDWIRAVNSAPNRMPSRGLDRVDIRWMKAGNSRSGAMAALMVSMPINRMPRPARIWPMCCNLARFTKTIRNTPPKATTGASAPTSRAMSRPVTVVPTLAPIISHTAWLRVIIPALTKPTTMTVVAEEDWTAAVISAPTSTPMKRLAVSRSRMAFIRLPATASRPELIICMPWRNSARPPKTPRNSSRFMFYLLCF